MATQLERCRLFHEDIEILEKAAAEELAMRSGMKRKPDQIMSDHVTNTLVSRIVERSAQLDQLYEDEDDLLKEDVASITGSGAIDAFYERLAHIRETHAASGPPLPIEADAADKMVASILEAEPPITFSGEERDGMYVDLHSCHELFLNLRHMKPIAPTQRGAKLPDAVDYYTYLVKHALAPELVPLPVARTAAYLRYLQEIVSYLADFVARTQPLLARELPRWRAELETEMQRRWQAGQCSRWQGGDAPAAESSAAHERADLSAFASAAELEAGLSAEAVKAELQACGLKCGGRPTERAERLWLSHAHPELIEPKHRAGPQQPSAPQTGNGADAGAAAASASERAGHVHVAVLEAWLLRLADLVRETVAETSAYVEKMASRTLDEIEADMRAVEEDELDDEAPSEEDTAPIYNPKKLPLGWDGKPIPYWLYKLHGLNLEYKCEVCGGASYWGPREFERHFMEARHSMGLRSLGIGNSAAYHGVTMMDDAFALQKTLAADEQRAKFVADLEEEFEDSLGNVMPKKTYDDLARQGLL